MAENQATFDTKVVSEIVKKAINDVIRNSPYDNYRVAEWCSAIVRKSLDNLREVYPEFKHIIQCIIMNKNGSGLHTASSVFWDNSSDGSLIIRWENKSMNILINSFSLSI